jgi:hypothetical protein
MSRGIWPRGIWPRGIWPRGIWPRGIWPRGIWKEESGSVESILILIPLMILFLSVMQLTVGVYGRLTTAQQTQGAVAFAAMGLSAGVAGANNPDNSGISGSLPHWSSPLIAMPLPGGGSVLVGTRETTSPTISPLLPLGDHFFSTGIAVQE